MNEAYEEGPDPERPPPFGWFTVLVVAVLVVGGWFVATRLLDQTRQEDCFQSGRHNCAPIDTTNPP
jgi:hypothetical protein